jgi:hypothetical protein
MKWSITNGICRHGCDGRSNSAVVGSFMGIVIFFLLACGTSFWCGYKYGCWAFDEVKGQIDDFEIWLKHEAEGEVDKVKEVWNKIFDR